MIIKFQASYMESPIMMRDSDIFHHYEIEQMNISIKLKKKILDWDAIYQSTFDDNYPPDSGFKDFNQELSHRAAGKILAMDLQKELGSGYRVESQY